MAPFDQKTRPAFGFSAGLPETGVDRELIRIERDRILASKAFALSKKLRSLLFYLTDNADSSVKEYAIGLEVFERQEDFDPKIDPIVRVHARRLREKLRDYYNNEGASDPVVIELPKGGYFVTISLRECMAKTLEHHPGNADIPVPSKGIAILPFHVLGGGAKHRDICDHLVEMMIDTLTLNGLPAICRTSVSKYKRKAMDVQGLGYCLNAWCVSEGSALALGGALHLRLRLVNTSNGFAFWSGSRILKLAEWAPCCEEFCDLVLRAVRSQAQILSEIQGLEALATDDGNSNRS